MSPSILIAEEENDLREYLGDLFRLRGCQVFLAANGSAALHHLASVPIQFAVIDMLLPGGSAFQILNDFTARTGGQGYSAMISRNASDDHQHYARALGADLFLVKPVSVESLLAAFEKHIADSDPLAVETKVG